MALLLCSILGIASISAAKPLNILTTDLTLTPTTESLSHFPLSSNTSINANNSTLELSAPHTVCWDQSEGVDLNGDQCKEALVNADFARLPPNDMLTFEARSSRLLAGHIGLPRRYHSSDGKCAIEPSLRMGVSSAQGTAKTFNEAANKLLSRCVDRSDHTGGMIYGIGGDGNLEVRVFPFDPHVQCYGSVNQNYMVSSCNNLADKMKASSNLVPFAPSGSWIPKVVPLPQREVDPDGGGCKLAVTIQKQKSSPLQFSSWFVVWQAVVAINAMCIRNGQRGKWLSLGHTIEDVGTIDVDVSGTRAEQQLPIAATA